MTHANDHPHTIFAVDDAETERNMLTMAFSEQFTIETYETAEACLNHLPSRTPDLFLLDVGLPGIDGYQMCQMLKQHKAYADIPVIFISARDDLESRLQGYDAGGIDFIVKPYRMEELRQKVALALEESDSRSTMRRQMEESETFTSLILSNLDEYALLIRFLRALSSCATSREVADALLAMLGSFKLNGAIQLRLRGHDVTLGPQGASQPLEVAVIQHVRTMGSIFEFKSRAAFNFPHVTVLLNNMPIDDSELCGRLRDHLAIAVESADSRLEALLTRDSQSRANERIHALLESLGAIVEQFSQRYDSARYRGSSLTQAMLDELTRSFASLGMSDAQEESILAIVRGRAFELVDLYDFGDDTQKTLNEVKLQLSAILDPLS